MLKLFKKDPQNRQQYNRDTEFVQVVLGVFGEIIRDNTREGVLLALNDAFGDKK